MGTDVHAVAQKKVGDAYEDVQCLWEQDRHYFLFAWLANVRNGFGFAGVPTFTPIEPIAKPRGLPEDFYTQGDGHPMLLEHVDPRRQQYWTAEECAEGYWMGDHSYSWLTWDEILSTPRPDNVWNTGIVPIEFFRQWDGHTVPEEWSGGISGPNIHVAESPTHVTDQTTHVRIYFKRREGELDYFINEIQRLKDTYGEGRLVFGFDS